MFQLIDKREFIYKYATNFAVISRFQWYPHPKRLIDESIQIQIRYLAHRARIELGYSERTGSVDIVWHLQSKYDEMIELQLFNN